MTLKTLVFRRVVGRETKPLGHERARSGQRARSRGGKASRMAHSRHLGPVPLSTRQFNSVGRLNLAFRSTPLVEKILSRQSSCLSLHARRKGVPYAKFPSTPRFNAASAPRACWSRRRRCSTATPDPTET